MEPYKPMGIRSTEYIHNPNSIKYFYHSIKYSHFLNLTPDRVAELDSIVDKWRHFFESDVTGYGKRMTFVAERLTTSAKKFELTTDDEKLYFYVKMIDPNFLFLEAFECANTREEFIALCKKNFYIIDSVIARLEKEINARFRLIENSDLLSRNQIDKNIETDQIKR